MWAFWNIVRKYTAMPEENDEGPRVRIAHLFRILLEQPHRYTIRELADKLGKSADTIEGDFQAIKTAGYQIEADSKWRYAFVLEKPYRQLKDLLHFSEEDQALLYQVIDNLPIGSERAAKLKNKLGSLYDFGRLGHAYLRKPYLNKVDLLEQARQDKKQVVLEGYRSSNSNTISNRIIEPFHVSPSEDTVQTFEIDKNKVNHFKISRITRVRILDQNWSHEGWHNIRRTDCFRIVGNEQVTVHLRLGVGAYNELIERFPLAKGHVEETQEEGIYDFLCPVNNRFLGLSNFILGFHHQGIEIVSPDSLRDHLRTEVGKMSF